MEQDAPTITSSRNNCKFKALSKQATRRFSNFCLKASVAKQDTSTEGSSQENGRLKALVPAVISINSRRTFNLCLKTLVSKQDKPAKSTSQENSKSKDSVLAVTQKFLLTYEENVSARRTSH